MARAGAVLRERSYVVPKDVQSVFFDVCAHRLILRPQAQVDGITARDILAEILQQIKPGTERYADMWKNRLAYGLVLLTAAVLLFLYSKPFLLTVLIVLLLLMVINGMLVLHDAHSIRVSMRVRPGGQ